MARIGIFGGSFNPPHIGHVKALQEAQRELQLDRILVMPAAQPPHKELAPGSPDAATRLALCRTAFACLPYVEVSDLELQRSGPSYTVDTLRALHAAYPNDQLVLLVGTDMYLTLDHWYQAETILRLADIVFVARNPQTVKEEAVIAAQQQTLLNLGARLTVLHNDVLPLSSTTVRRMLAFGCGAPYLPVEVGDLIAEQGLYLSPAKLRGLSIPQLEDVAVQLLNPRRVPHVLGCRDTAVKLAQRCGADPVAAERAALLHDITKALDPAEQLQLMSNYAMMEYLFDPDQPQLLHSVTGALVAEHVFGETHAVCDAIRWHTTGKPDMSVLEKVLYLADYMEPTRDFEGVSALRDAVWRDLDEGLTLALSMSVTELQSEGRKVAQDTVLALAYMREPS